MAHLPTLEKMRVHYEENLVKYILMHSGEYLMLEPTLIETFYKKRQDFQNAKIKYEGITGTIPLFTQIPIKYSGSKKEGLEALLLTINTAKTRKK